MKRPASQSGPPASCWRRTRGTTSRTWRMSRARRSGPTWKVNTSMVISSRAAHEVSGLLLPSAAYFVRGSPASRLELRDLGVERLDAAPHVAHGPVQLVQRRARLPDVPRHARHRLVDLLRPDRLV